MKTTTCNNLRGACEAKITGESAEEMGQNSQKHVMEMIQAGDKDHAAAIEEMKKLSPEDQQKWYGDFKQNFDSLPNA